MKLIILLPLIIFLSIPFALAKRAVGCTVPDALPFVDAPEDYDKWVSQRAYANERERKRDLRAATRGINARWQKKMLSRELDKGTENKFLAAYLRNERTKDFNSQVKKAKEALVSDEDRRSPSSVSYTSAYADFYLHQADLRAGNSPTLEQFEQKEKYLKVLMARINKMKEKVKR